MGKITELKSVFKISNGCIYETRAEAIDAQNKIDFKERISDMFRDYDFGLNKEEAGRFMTLLIDDHDIFSRLFCGEKEPIAAVDK